MTIRVGIENATAIIWDDVLEENGWIIRRTLTGEWALWENMEFEDKPPFKIYPNHALDEAIAQGKKWK